MCARYHQHKPRQLLLLMFNVTKTLATDQPRYNIAPTQSAPVVRLEPNGERALVDLRWGLIPSWSRDPKIARRLINARGETLDQKPSFRAAFRSRRCLVPATGFYEWRHQGRARKPSSVTHRDRELMAFAGLWERWRDPHGEWVETYAIVTREASSIMRGLHDRMPVIVPPSDFGLWLGETNATSDDDVLGATSRADMTRLRSLLHPSPNEDVDHESLVIRAVSDRVGNVAHDDPDLLEPELTLF